MKLLKILVLTPIFVCWISFAFAIHVDSLSYGIFGKVKVYQPQETIPKAFVIFISGDGGWNLGVVNMAKILADKGAIVVGINIRTYLKNLKKEKVKCYYPAGDFENLSIALQKKYHSIHYLKPILAGFSSGATLTYGLLAQAPANTFKGAIALSFCPDLDIDKPLCNGEGLTSHVLKLHRSYDLEPTKKLSAPFIALQGEIDQVCSSGDAKKFLEAVHNAEVISLPKVGHGFTVKKNWKPQFVDAFNKLVAAPSYIEKIKSRIKKPEGGPVVANPFADDLPLNILPASKPNNLPMAFMISGDGGWTSFDQTLAEKLNESGIAVVGLDAQQYFWDKKSPDETATMISKVVKYYAEKWDKSSFIMVGYSFGASILPFVNNRLSPPLKAELKNIYCLSPDETADFEIHLSDMLSLGGKEEYNVLEELRKIKNIKPVCFFGKEEEDINTEHYTASGAKVVLLAGGHHYDDSYPIILKTILGSL